MLKNYTIDAIKEITVPIAKKYGVAKLAVFGSYAKNTATQYSDVDFLVDTGKAKGLQFVGLIMDMEEALKVHVDVLTYNQLPYTDMSEVINDEVVIYEQ